MLPWDGECQVDHRKVQPVLLMVLDHRLMQLAVQQFRLFGPPLQPEIRQIGTLARIDLQSQSSDRGLETSSRLGRIRLGNVRVE